MVRLLLRPFGMLKAQDASLSNFRTIAMKLLKLNANEVITLKKREVKLWRQLK